jgi:hypothetical protein
MIFPQLLNGLPRRLQLRFCTACPPTTANWSRGGALTGGGGAVGYAMAYLSYESFENGFLRLKPLFQKAKERAPGS